MTVISIPLSRGQTAIVDADDAAVLAHSWHAHPIQRATGGFYASARINGRTVYLHRLLTNAPKGMLVDHINGDGLDNRRANLRLCTTRENAINRDYPRRTSGYRGVESSGLRWRVLFENEGKRYRVGLFDDAATAARAYDALAREFHGEFAILNNPLKAEPSA